MPIDNDYFKNRQQQNKGSNNQSNNNGGGNGGGYEPPFQAPEMFKNFNKQSGIIYAIIIIAIGLFMKNHMLL